MTSKNKQRDPIEWWVTYPCEHRASVAGFYGLGISFRCQDCNKNMSTKYNEAVKEFDVTIGFENSYVEDNKNKTKRLSIKKMADFLANNISVKIIPDPPGDPNGSQPEEDANRFSMLVNLLSQNGFDLLANSQKFDSTNTTTTCSCCGGREHSD